jgi:hypothetical protein
MTLYYFVEGTSSDFSEMESICSASKTQVVNSCEISLSVDRFVHKMCVFSVNRYVCLVIQNLHIYHIIVLKFI